ncbi:MAG: anti-sigma factor antagonist [Spirochaetae bacterium HGW-Spirochaetae-1]|jgi:anti-anti-sigma factor|nr:MAG: anti-sigma factor antagonist [Spirochaetae bacterium HGW-Spirochaetae-1]
MNQRTKNIGDITIVYLSGRLDIFESEMAEKDIVSILEKNEDSHIILVLEDLDYLSSSGLRIFISLKRTLESRGQMLLLCNKNNNAVKIFFKIVNIKDMFTIFETEDEAVGYLSGLQANNAIKIA